MIEIRWHGRGGQGSFTASKLLGASASLYGGSFALAFPSFGPERRGAPVLAFTKIDHKKIEDRSEIKKCDYIVVLDETLYSESFLKDLKDGGKIILNSSEDYSEKSGGRVYSINASEIALEILGRPITNTAMFGALAGISGIVSPESARKGMEGYLKGSILNKNIQVFDRAYSLFSSKSVGLQEGKDE